MLTFAPGAVLTHSNIREDLEAASRILEAEGHPAIRVVDGDRSYQAQVTVFLARYVLGEQIRGRRVYDIRKWEGRTYYRISPAGTVAAPSRLAPHVRGVAADLGTPYNNRNTAAHKRLQQLAPGLGLDWTGRHFAEDWHWETTRGPGPAGIIDEKGFLMALNDKQQDELYAWVKDIQMRVRGGNPDADMLQIIEAATTDTAKRVRGENPVVDMLQDILGHLKAVLTFLGVKH